MLNASMCVWRNVRKLGDAHWQYNDTVIAGGRVTWERQIIFLQCRSSRLDSGFLDRAIRGTWRHRHCVVAPGVTQMILVLLWRGGRWGDIGRQQDGKSSHVQQVEPEEPCKKHHWCNPPACACQVCLTHHSVSTRFAFLRHVRNSAVCLDKPARSDTKEQ
jgi:hypothetical protein